MHRHKLSFTQQVKFLLCADTADYTQSYTECIMCVHEWHEVLNKLYLRRMLINYMGLV